MRTLVFLSTLALTACTSNNPFFGLDTDATGSSGGSTTTAATTANPTTTEDPPTTTPPDTTTEPLTTAGPTTESPTTPVTSGSSDPGTTAIDPDTTTGVAESSSSGSSTGAELCELSKDPDFSGLLYKDDVIAECQAVNYIPGKLLKGDGPLRLATTNTGCPNEAGKGTLSIGKGYDLPLPADSPCGKLYLFRDGLDPTCDIAHFFFVANNLPYATGSFTPGQPPMNPPVALTAPVEEVLWEACCPIEAQDCCNNNMGDYSLVFPPVQDPVAPGQRIDNVPGEAGALLSIINIQDWTSAICDPNMDKNVHTSDWAAVRTK